MPEKIRFPSPEEKKEREIAETLKKEGGIFYREEFDPESGKVKRFVNILGVEIETYASGEDIEAIKKEMVLSEVDQEMLRTIAECYKLSQPLLFEGDPGVGKTFLMKKFVQLIHGKEAPILELVGTPRTSELEILGHWAPKGLTKKEAEEYKELLRQFMEVGAGKDLSAELNQKLSDLNQKFLSGHISQEQFQEEFGELTTQYINRSRSLIAEITQMAKFIKPESEWEFKEGALLQAYSGREGRGYILIVDEFNLIPPNYQQIFLQIGGEKGALSESISFWGDSGRTRYQRGKDTWICFASNYPEKTPGRSEVVAPVADRLVWKVITPEETEIKRAIIAETAGGELKFDEELIKEIHKAFGSSLSFEAEKATVTTFEVPAIEQIKLKENRLLNVLINHTVTLLDREFFKYYQEVGDSITIKGQKRRRNQQFEFSGRNPLRLYSYLDHFQVRDPETGQVDFTKTLFNAFKRYYLSRLVDNEGREKMIRLFWEIMTGVTGKIEFEGKIRTRKEVLDILVKRASISPKVLEQLEKEEVQRELNRARYAAQDALESLLNNPAIPESIRRMLEEIEV